MYWTISTIHKALFTSYFLYVRQLSYINEFNIPRVEAMKYLRLYNTRTKYSSIYMLEYHVNPWNVSCKYNLSLYVSFSPMGITYYAKGFPFSIVLFNVKIPYFFHPLLWFFPRQSQNKNSGSYLELTYSHVPYQSHGNHLTILLGSMKRHLFFRKKMLVVIKPAVPLHGNSYIPAKRLQRQLCFINFQNHVFKELELRFYQHIQLPKASFKGKNYLFYNPCPLMNFEQKFPKKSKWWHLYYNDYQCTISWLFPKHACKTCQQYYSCIPMDRLYSLKHLWHP